MSERQIGSAHPVLGHPSTIQLNQLVRVIFAARSEVVVKNAQTLRDEIIEPSKQRSVPCGPCSAPTKTFGR